MKKIGSLGERIPGAPWIRQWYSFIIDQKLTIYTIISEFGSCELYKKLHARVCCVFPTTFLHACFCLCFIGYLTETANVSRESILSTFTAFTMPSLSLVQKYLMRSEDKSWAGNTTKLLAGEKLYTNCFLPIFHQLHINSEFSHSTLNQLITFN